MTDLLYLREPQRRQCLATVAGTRGPYFLLDKTIFAPTSHRYRHPQPADRGEVWVGGDKRVLTRVVWDRGELKHAVRGVTPTRGTAVRCHLDADRRDDASAAHTAMHLVVSAFARMRLGVLTDEPEVHGGRRFTLRGRFDASGPALKRLLDAANAAAARPHEVTVEFRTRDAMRDVDVQPFVDGVGVPGEEPVVPVVSIGDASRLPCDGTFVARTAALGPIRVRLTGPAKGGARVQFDVAKPATKSAK